MLNMARSKAQVRSWHLKCICDLKTPGSIHCLYCAKPCLTHETNTNTHPSNSQHKAELQIKLAEVYDRKQKKEPNSSARAVLYYYQQEYMQYTYRSVFVYGELFVLNALESECSLAAPKAWREGRQLEVARTRRILC